VSVIVLRADQLRENDILWKLQKSTKKNFFAPGHCMRASFGFSGIDFCKPERYLIATGAEGRKEWSTTDFCQFGQSSGLCWLEK
jgi:hypothetical protein